MTEQPQMNEKLRARMQKGAEALMEPGEQVVYGVTNLTMPVWIYAAFVGLLVLPYVIQKSSMAVVTDRNVYVFKTGGLGFKARRVLLKTPLGSADAEIAGGAFPGRYLRIGDQKIYLAANRRIHERARAIAAVASGATSAAALTDTSAATAAQAGAAAGAAAADAPSEPATSSEGSG